MQLSWSIDYADGTFLTQWESGEEVAYRKIDWAKAVRLHLENDQIRMSFDLAPPDEGTFRSLRSRSFRTLSLDGTTNDSIDVFMLVASTAENPDNIAAENVREIIYIFPNGTTHVCPHFECGEVAAVAAKWNTGKTVGIMPYHRISTVAGSIVTV